MILSLELLGCVCSLVIVAVLTRWALGFGGRRALPPGPRGLPLVGYLPFLGGDAHLCFADLAEKYGPIFSLKLGSQFVVVLSDHKLVREAFRREDFTARPLSEFTNILGGYGIINSEGKLWKDQRKFLHDRLRKFGMTYTGSAKDHMESRIMVSYISPLLKPCLPSENPFFDPPL
jgi:26-hydroxylase